MSQGPYNLKVGVRPIMREPPRVWLDPAKDWYLFVDGHDRLWEVHGAQRHQLKGKAVRMLFERLIHED